MRAVVTRVASASVAIGGETVGKIGRGFLVLLIACRLAEKVCALRVFTDPEDRMNLGLEDVGGGVLVVSQFTLYGECRKGRRPSFIGAAQPDLAIPLYEAFLQRCAQLGYAPQHGEFGASMQVLSVNDGPVTLILDTEEWGW